MPKLLKLILIASAILIVILLLLITVWGQTIRMADANHYFQTTDYDTAQSIYQDLAVDLPNSRNIQHNLGLCLYQEGLYERAIKCFRRAILRQSPQHEQTDVYYYHLGNAYFKAATRNGIEPASAVQLFTAAFDSFKKALTINPNDLTAKYNYELAVIHLKQLANQPQHQQNQQQEVQNMMQNIQNSAQYKGQSANDNSPPNGEDW